MTNIYWRDLPAGDTTIRFPKGTFIIMGVTRQDASPRKRPYVNLKNQFLREKIAVPQYGPNVLKKDACRDPFGAGPFKYARKTNGFQLQSTLVQSQGQPVSLTVGRP